MGRKTDQISACPGKAAHYWPARLVVSMSWTSFTWK